MEGKRLDLDAPLISVRRIAARQLSRDAARSGYLDNGGAVPFIWEKRPGHPKVASRCSSDCRKEKLIAGEMVMVLNPVNCGEELDAFSDCRDTLSCNESFSVKSGLTGLSARHSFSDSANQFSKDLKMEEYMMGRFLHAAQAVASGSPQQVWKKPPRAPVVDKNFATARFHGSAPKTQLESNFRQLDSQKAIIEPDSQKAQLSQMDPKSAPRRRLPLHYLYQEEEEEEEEEEDKEEVEESGEIVSYDDKTSYFSSKARRLISRLGLKSSSFCLLNPLPGMKVRDLPPTKPSPRIKILNNEGIVEDSWEAVYRHRLRNVDDVKKDIDSKLSTESSQLTYCFDSPTLDGSSSFNHSSVDAKNKSKCSKTCSLDSGKEDIECYWEIPSGIGRLQGSSSTSSTTDKSHINSSPLPDTSNSNSCLVSKTACTKVSEFQKTEGNVVAETSGRYQPQSKNFESKAAGEENNIDNSVALSLLPPPLPKPPSDSWLQRALPAISAKGPFQQPFYGNQSLQASRGGQKLVTSEKSSKMHTYQTTFAGVPKPAC